MSMKIKTALDMQGNGIENFLIQGVSAIEGLSDKSLGRKILYTGTNTDRNYREMIYIGNSIGGDGWRTTAYMSDVDELRGLITALENATDEEIEALKGRATTTEGNLATLRSEFDALNKALNDDTAGTIDTWNEIQNFVGKYDGSEDLETILSRMNAEIDTKFDKAGGTIEGASSNYTPLIVKTTSLSEVWIAFEDSVGTTHIGSVKGVPSIYSGSGNQTLLHSGNVGEYAALISDDIFAEGQPNNALGYSYSGSSGLTQAGPAMVFGKDNYRAYLFGRDGVLKFNTMENGTLTGWKTIAFTDSTVAAANRLVTDAGVNMVLGTGSDVYVGGGTFDNTYIHGKQVVLRYGTGAKFGLRLNSSGGVTIGEKDLAGTDAKLYVDGGIVVGKNATIGVTDSNDKRLPALQLNNSNNTHNLLLGQYTAKEGYNTVIYGNEIRLCYSNAGTSSLTALLVNSSGNVGIGVDSPTERLDVGGAVKATNATITNYIYANAFRTEGESGVWKGNAFTSALTATDLVIKGDTVKVVGDLYVEGNIIATKEVSAGGAATEGNGGAGGFSLYESWGTSAPTEPLALGANLGYELKTRVEDLELAKTKVTFEPALVSGKQIGTIEIDGNKTNLFAPATYAWSEITSKPTTLAGYGITDALPLTGGTITSSAQTMLTINGTNSLLSQIVIQSAGENKARFGWSGSTAFSGYRDGVFMFNNVCTSSIGIKDDGTPYYNDNTLLHSGNVGEYKAGDSDKLGGYNASGYAVKRSYPSTSDTNWSMPSGIYPTTTVTEGLPLSGVGNHVIHCNWDVNAANQLFLAFDSDLFAFRRKHGNVWQDWKTIAFTDSDITGNAATATKLATPRTIWGQSFDGTGNVDGVFTIGGSGHNYFNTRLSSNAFLVGLDESGNTTTFEIGWRNKADMSVVINASGNVTIGGSDLAGSNYRLYVDGLTKARALELGNIITLNRGYNSGAVLDSTMSALKIETYPSYVGFNVYTSGNTTRSHTLVLSDSGNVLIGTANDNGSGAKLQVAGDISLTTAILTDNQELLRRYSDSLYIGYGSAVKGSLPTSIWGNEIRFINSSGQRIITIADNGNLLVGTMYDNGAKLQVAGGASVSSLEVNGTSAFYGSTTFGKEGVSMQVNFKCPVVAEDRVTIGGATLRWDDEIKALRLNTSLAATGELSAGGAGTEGGNTGGGGTGTIASPFSRTFTPNEKTSFTFSHDLPYYDVVVQVYEWDSSGMCWNMVLADIEIQNNDVTVTLGKMENVEHKIVVR